MIHHTRKQRIQLQPSYVLHKKSYRDTSLIVDLLTPEHGRVAVVAKGAKKARSRNAALLQGFQPLLVSWTGSGELGTLTAVEAQGRSLQLSGRSLICGLYVNELLMRCLHVHEQQIELFGLYDELIRELAQPQPDSVLQAILRTFEMKLLQTLGYGLILDHDVDSNSIDATAAYDFQGQGFVLLTNQEALGIKVSGRTLQCLHQNTLRQDNDAHVLREAKVLMRFALSHHIGNKPLMSRELFRRIPLGQV